MREVVIVGALGVVVAIVGVVSTVNVCVNGSTVVWRGVVGVLGLASAACGIAVSVAAGAIVADIDEARNGPDELVAALTQSVDNGDQCTVTSSVLDTITNAVDTYDTVSEIEAEYAAGATIAITVLLLALPPLIASGLQISSNRCCYAAAAPLLTTQCVFMLALAVASTWACATVLPLNKLSRDVRWMFETNQPGLAPYMTKETNAILQACGNPVVQKWITSGPLAGEYDNLKAHACTDVRYSAAVGAAAAGLAVASGFSALLACAKPGYTLMRPVLIGF